MAVDQNESKAVARADELYTCINEIIEKSLKEFPYVKELNNCMLGAVTYIKRAHDKPLKYGDMTTLERRNDYQRKAMTQLDNVMYLLDIAKEHDLVPEKQYKQAKFIAYDCKNRVFTWMRTDSMNF